MVGASVVQNMSFTAAFRPAKGPDCREAGALFTSRVVWHGKHEFSPQSKIGNHSQHTLANVSIV